MITRIKDIEQIVVANRNGIPVHISDVGTVRFGAPKRFGAMTMDGKGECVGGIAMMLKGCQRQCSDAGTGKAGGKDTALIARRHQHRTVSEPFGTGQPEHLHRRQQPY